MIAIVTGASRGIGYAIADKFASEGFDVIINAMTESGLEKSKKELSEKYPNSTIHKYTADLSKEDQVKAFSKYCLSVNDKPDVLVNNAGSFLPGSVHEEEEGTLQKMIDTNLFSAYHLSRGIVPLMKEAKNGHIFNMCSTASIMAYPAGGSYSISKFALLGLSKALRAELKSFNIKVSAVLPGATYTDSWKGSDYPKERFMRPEDIAEIMWTAYKIGDRTNVEELVLRPIEGDI